MLTTVLAPVDFSSDSEHGLRLASQIARRHSATLLVLHVDGLPEYSNRLGQTDPDHEWQTYLAAHDAAVRQRLEQFVAPLEHSGPLELVVTRGQPAEAIERFAIERAVDLVVIAPRGGGYGQQFLLGSVSAQVATDASCPVLVARSRSGQTAPSGEFSQPVVAVSDPELAKRTLGVAMKLSVCGTHIELLHVLESFEIAVGPPLPGSFREAVRHSREAIRDRLAILTAHAAEQGFPTSVRVETGDPSFSILCRIESGAHDLVAVSRKTGRDGRGKLSTPAYRMVKHAPVPVLVVPE